MQLNPEADMYVPDIYNRPCPATRDMPGACNNPCPESCDIPGDSVRTLSESSSAASSDSASDTVHSDLTGDKSVNDRPKIDNRNTFGKSSVKTYAVLTTRSGDFRCHRCSTSNIVAKHVEFIKMYPCHKCKVHICEKNVIL